MDPVSIAILLLLGCGLFLEGCASHDKENSEFLDPWTPLTEEEIEAHLRASENKSDSSIINNYATLRCTSGGENKVSLENTSGNAIQGGTAATNLDIDLAGEGFINCSTASDKRCIPEIEGNRWLCTDENHTSNGCPGVSCISFLFCLHGFGMIYVEKDGQKEGEMRAFGAFYIMELWLNEGYDIVSQEQLTKALEDAKNYGGQNQVKNFNIVEVDESELDDDMKPEDYIIKDENKTKFDTSILAWTNFWNVRMEKELGKGNFTPVRAEVIKCMMAVESRMGEPDRKNTERDVMQCLFLGDGGIWAITQIDPYAPGKSHYGETEQVINVEQIDGNIIPGSLPHDYHSDDTSLQEWFGNGSWKVFSKVITGVEKEDQEYTYHYNEVTTDMSIGIGVGEYAYKVNIKGGGSEENGVYLYNNSQYVKKHVRDVKWYMKGMGEELDGYK